MTPLSIFYGSKEQDFKNESYWSQKIIVQVQNTNSKTNKWEKEIDVGLDKVTDEIADGKADKTKMKYLTDVR